MKVRNTYSDVIEGEENITNVSKELQGDMTSPTGSTAQRILGHQEDPSELIQRLTAAIQAGDGLGAASLAEELSNLKLKLDISVPNDDSGQQSKEKEFSVKVHVEDRVSEGCTFNLMVKASDTIQDLKNKVMIKYNFPVEVQRWIIGRKIPDNKDHLRQHGIKRAGHTLYLYLMTARSVGLNPQDYQAQREAILDGRNPLISNFYLSGTPSPLPRERPTEWPPTPSSPSDIHPQVYSNPSSPVPSPSPVFEMGELDHGQIQHTGPSRQASKRSLTSGSSLIHDMLSSSIGPPDNRPKSFNSDSGTSGLSGWAEGSQQDLGRSGRTGPRSRTPPRTPPPNIEDDETAGWECPACTYINLPTRPGCEICSGPRPSDYHVPDGYQMTPMELLMKENEQRTERMTREATAVTGPPTDPRPPVEPRGPQQRNFHRITPEQLRENLQFIEALNLHENTNNNTSNNAVFRGNYVFVPGGGDWDNMQEVTFRPHPPPGATADLPQQQQRGRSSHRNSSPAAPPPSAPQHRHQRPHTYTPSGSPPPILEGFAPGQYNEESDEEN